jgi:hypothetical protein
MNPTTDYRYYFNFAKIDFDLESILHMEWNNVIFG